MISRTEEITDRRLVFEKVPYSSKSRIKIWWNRVYDAITTPPPKEWTREIEVGPDDPRWEKGLAFVITWSSGVSFDLGDKFKSNKNMSSDDAQ